MGSVRVPFSPGHQRCLGCCAREVIRVHGRRALDDLEIASLELAVTMSSPKSMPALWLRIG